MKDKAYQICREFLSGSWKKISSNDMVFKAVSGGLSNILFYCSLPSTHTPLNGEPAQVLLRMYGQMHSDSDDKSQTTITESVIFMLLSERKLGPKLYGIFPGGRLEEYISARAMTCEELRNPLLSTIIARKLANVHTLNVPVNKEPVWIFETMHKWLDAVRKFNRDQIKPEYKDLANSLLAFDFETEIQWLKVFLRRAKSPAVFCHNDLQEGNILLPEHSTKVVTKSKSSSNVLSELECRVVLIDFEYCAYNYRGFDLANHFCEWALDYSNPEWPHFHCNWNKFPSEEQQRHFIREYLRWIKSDDENSPVNTEQHALVEAMYFVLASHLLWTVWSLFNAFTSEIKFGYWAHQIQEASSFFGPLV